MVVEPFTGTFNVMEIISTKSSTSATNLVDVHFTEEPLKRLARAKVGNMTKAKAFPNFALVFLITARRSGILGQPTGACGASGVHAPVAPSDQTLSALYINYEISPWVSKSFNTLRPQTSFLDIIRAEKQQDLTNNNNNTKQSIEYLNII